MIGLAFGDLLRVFVPEIVSLFFFVHSNFLIYFYMQGSVCLFLLLFTMLLSLTLYGLMPFLMYR